MTTSPSYWSIFLIFLISHVLFWIGIFWYHVKNDEINYGRRQINIINAIDTQEEDKSSISNRETIITISKPYSDSSASSKRIGGINANLQKLKNSHSNLIQETPSAANINLQNFQKLDENVDFEEYRKYVESQNEERYRLNSALALTNADLFYSYIPQISCETKVRVGGFVDGAKWVCNPWHLAKSSNCTVYSLGVGMNVIFDREFSQKFQCRIFAFDSDDMSAAYLKKNVFPRLVFEPWYVDGNGPRRSRRHKTLRQIIDNYRHGKIDILKIDVEGAEFEILDSYFKNEENYPTVQICQILMEVHTWNVMKWRRLFRTLEKVGFLLFSREINLLGFGSKMEKIAVEYSYIHSTCLSEYGLNDTRFFLNFPPENYFTTTQAYVPL